MAIVVPYGDTQAHGSIACSLTFRRFRNKVVLEKKPYPKQPNTPAQIAIRNKFKQAWAAYHTLSPWTLEYLKESGKQYGWSGANLFISQYMQDEVPSTIPMNNIKEIIDLSLPLPIAPDPEGIKYEFTARIDAPPSEDTLAHIFDNENVFYPGAGPPAYNRSRLLLSRADTAPIDIPFNYPIILVWKDFNDFERTNLVRLPAFTLQKSGIPSDTPIMNVKEIISANIHTTIGAQPKNIYFEFWNKQTTTPPDVLIGTINDNENVYHPEMISPETGQFYIAAYTYNPSSIFLTDGYQVSITYKDFGDVEHIVDIIFPEVEIGPAPTASNTPLLDYQSYSRGNIVITVGRYPTHIYFYFKVADAGLTNIRDAWEVQDNANSSIGGAGLTPYAYYFVDVVLNVAEDITIPFNYQIFSAYIPPVPVEKEMTIYFPAFLPKGVGISRFFIADDGSVWADKEYTQILHIPGTPRQIFWIADDGSTYWDEAMTNLAKSSLIMPPAFYIADDFSLYYDEAMTDLASTPFF